jgi:CubicO group peptidase (beta-lactamase class C family)
VLQGGAWNSEQIVPAAYLAEAIQPAPELRDEQGNPVNYYGYQFWIAQLVQPPVPHFAGILGQYIFVLPHLNAVVVRLGHREDPNFNDGIAYLQAAQMILEAR